MYSRIESYKVTSLVFYLTTMSFKMINITMEKMKIKLENERTQLQHDDNIGKPQNVQHLTLILYSMFAVLPRIIARRIMPGRACSSDVESLFSWTGTIFYLLRSN